MTWGFVVVEVAHHLVQEERKELRQRMSTDPRWLVSRNKREGKYRPGKEVSFSNGRHFRPFSRGFGLTEQGLQRAMIKLWGCCLEDPKRRK